MTYQLCRRDEKRISIEVDGCETFVFERTTEGVWQQFLVRNGKPTPGECNEDGETLIDRTAYHLTTQGHAAKVADGYVLPVPAAASDFFISGLGFLCCRLPQRKLVSSVRVGELGIKSPHQIRPATREEERSAGIDGKDTTLKTVFLMP
ncbi:hypothetical protein WL29_20435 [Burkholderia ubonensis]|uniref:Uncharacterized protein n=1 Tax=Burkholderia ubonensis TaxID=101571 RepID=A0A106QBC5_9BURK|nr:hypothetical protein [Burkholderia ubonensis]KWA83736.1 hypothetical protein WL29_20435 [Burkholderia ubonensis]